jgi:hypothetical protein
MSSDSVVLHKLCHSMKCSKIKARIYDPAGCGDDGKIESGSIRHVNDLAGFAALGGSDNAHAFHLFDHPSGTIVAYL